MESMQFEITTKEGKKRVCDVIATYHDDEVNKDFIVYTDNTYDSSNKLNIFYSLYEKKDGKIKLINISEAKDKKIGLELIKELLKEIS